MILLLLAFFAGILTVLAPCVLPLLPIILGSSLQRQKYASAIVILSLWVSIFVFSLLLKTTTLFIEVPASFWKSLSGGILVVLGIITLFPEIWKKCSTYLRLSDKSNMLLSQGSQKTGIWKYIFMGAALGPVFSSCSPTYSLILAIILPASYFFGLLALIFYIFWLASILWLIAFFGQRFASKLKWAANPKGIFQKIMGFVFLLIGLAIITGLDKKIESKILDTGFLGTISLEENIIKNFDLDATNLGKEKNMKISSPQEQNTCENGICEKESLSPLPDQKDILSSQAPDIVWLENWINSEPIESLQELKWQVVALKFWTLGCINCINTLEHTEKLYQKYKTDGFTILGVHSPEFSYEHKLEELQKAVEKYGLTFPVAQDNDFATWKAYDNRYWPALYLIDKQGNIRFTHFGEGKYQQIESKVQELLAE